jgi:protein phosphatase
LGGHEAGEVASQMAVRLVADQVARRVLVPEVAGEICLAETAIELLIEAVNEVNGQIYLARQRAGNEMGATLTAALVLRDTAIVVNVGDSRTYLWQTGKLEQITTDHSAVARLVEVGQVKPEEIYTHPQKSAIYRSLGDKPSIEVDHFVCQLASGDRLLLCCDGIWESLRPDGLEEVLLAQPEPQAAAHEIIKRANLAGGEDNLSVVIVAVEAG